jgi:hypothetical protein
MIGSEAFANCDSLQTVTYSGSLMQWEKIRIDDNNDPLLRAKKIINNIAQSPYLQYENVGGITWVVGIGSCKEPCVYIPQVNGSGWSVQAIKDEAFINNISIE